MEIFNLFTCDAWHSNSSMAFQSSHKNIHSALEAAEEIAKNQEEGNLSGDDYYNFIHILQTQGRSDNFYVVKTNLN